MIYDYTNCYQPWYYIYLDFIGWKSWYAYPMKRKLDKLDRRLRPKKFKAWLMYRLWLIMLLPILWQRPSTYG